ncbi:MAG: hypothetical protein U5K55_00535 [Aliarcobacter sp.]|nr:hypothetical protein [Aliarcobacter sp.]
MFQTAILPGLLAVLFFVMVILIQVRIKPELGPASEPLTKEERNKALWGLFPVILTFWFNYFRFRFRFIYSNT